MHGEHLAVEESGDLVGMLCDDPRGRSDDRLGF